MQDRIFRSLCKNVHYSCEFFIYLYFLRKKFDIDDENVALKDLNFNYYNAFCITYVHFL